MRGTHETARYRRGRSPRALRGERGAALVEFALILPVLLLLIVGMLEFGKAINYWIDTNHLANVAARWAAVDKNPGASQGWTLQRTIREQANTVELREGDDESDPLNVCIEFPEGGATNVGAAVKATVSVDYNWMPFLGELLGTSSKLTSDVTMRLEQVPSEYTAGCEFGA